MFVRVQSEQLVVGTKYKITVFPYEVEFDRYSGIFKDSTTYPNQTYLEFEHPYDLIIEERCSIGTVFLTHNNYCYYVFVSDQPQWNMERRAVNLIVRRLIGDDNFEW